MLINEDQKHFFYPDNAAYLRLFSVINDATVCADKEKLRL